MPRYTIQEWLYMTLSTSDKHEALRILKATEYLLALWDVDQWLRAQVKYGDMPEQEKVGYENARGELWNILASYNISLDEMR